VSIAFSVAGESYLAVLDALYDVSDHLRLVTCRHEANAANMAEAVGKLTGRPGVCLVTRGPGATHASIAIHTADQDATPLVMFVGQVARSDLGRGAFQEIDYSAMFGHIAKAVIEIRDPDELPMRVARAFELAVSDRPGPVVVTLPEDLLELECASPTPAYAARVEIELPQMHCGALEARLRAAQRPVLWVGGSGWSEDGVNALRQFAAAWRLPVVSGFRRKDLVSNDSAEYVGELGFVLGAAAARALREADLLLVIGAALGDVETGGYTRLDPALTGQTVLHVAMRALDLGRVFPVSIGVVASPSAAARALSTLPLPAIPTVWEAWTRELRQRYEADVMAIAVSGVVNLSAVFRELRRQLPDDAIVTNGAGNYAAWLHRFFSVRAFRTQLAPQSGAMGYGVPAGIAAALLHPDRRVVAVAGDGCFMMAAQDLVTAAREGARVVFLVINNGTYGTIRMHQAMRFPGRTIGTTLVNPDFVALSEASGVPAVRVETDERFAHALAEALSAAGPRLIEIVTSAEDIAPGRRLSTLEARSA